MRITSLQVCCAVLIAAMLLQGLVTSGLDAPAARTASTVFVAVCVQALPFLVLGVLLSAAITAFVSPRVLRRVLPGPAGVVPRAASAPPARTS